MPYCMSTLHKHGMLNSRRELVVSALRPTPLTLFPISRLKKGKQLDKEEAIISVKKNIHLIRAPHAGESAGTTNEIQDSQGMRRPDPHPMGSGFKPLSLQFIYRHPLARCLTPTCLLMTCLKKVIWIKASFIQVLNYNSQL